MSPGITGFEFPQDITLHGRQIWDPKETVNIVAGGSPINFGPAIKKCGKWDF